MRGSSGKSSATANEGTAHMQPVLDSLLHLAEVAATLDTSAPAGADGSSSAPSDQECLGYQFLDPTLAAYQQNYGAQREHLHTVPVPLQHVPPDDAATLVQSLLQSLQQSHNALETSLVSKLQYLRRLPASCTSNPLHPAAFNTNPIFAGSSMLASTAPASEQPRAVPAAKSSSTLQPSSQAAPQTAAPTASARRRSEDAGLWASILSKLQPANAATLAATLGLCHTDSAAKASEIIQPPVEANQQLHSATVTAAAANCESDEEAGGSPGVAGPRTQRWTDEEHSRLEALVQHHGTKNWSTIAAHLPGRTGKQCRERYLNHTYKLRKGNWELQEEFIIAQLHSRWGNRWAAIARHLPGRSDNCLKNHWNALMRAKKPSQEKTTHNLLWLYCRHLRQGAAPSEALQAVLTVIPEKDRTMLQSLELSPSRCPSAPGAAVAPLLNTGLATNPPEAVECGRGHQQDAPAVAGTDAPAHQRAAATPEAAANMPSSPDPALARSELWPPAPQAACLPTTAPAPAPVVSAAAATQPAALAKDPVATAAAMIVAAVAAAAKSREGREPQSSSEALAAAAAAVAKAATQRLAKGGVHDPAPPALQSAAQVGACQLPTAASSRALLPSTGLPVQQELEQQTALQPDPVSVIAEQQQCVSKAQASALSVLLQLRKSLQQQPQEVTPQQPPTLSHLPSRKEQQQELLAKLQQLTAEQQQLLLLKAAGMRTSSSPVQQVGVQQPSFRPSQQQPDCSKQLTASTSVQQQRQEQQQQEQQQQEQQQQEQQQQEQQKRPPPQALVQLPVAASDSQPLAASAMALAPATIAQPAAVSRSLPQLLLSAMSATKVGKPSAAVAAITAAFNAVRFDNTLRAQDVDSADGTYLGFIPAGQYLAQLRAGSLSGMTSSAQMQQIYRGQGSSRGRARGRLAKLANPTSAGVGPVAAAVDGAADLNNMKPGPGGLSALVLELMAMQEQQHKLYADVSAKGLDGEQNACEAAAGIEAVLQMLRDHQQLPPQQPKSKHHQQLPPQQPNSEHKQRQAAAAKAADAKRERLCKVVAGSLSSSDLPSTASVKRLAARRARQRALEQYLMTTPPCSVQQSQQQSQQTSEGQNQRQPVAVASSMAVDNPPADRHVEAALAATTSGASQAGGVGDVQPALAHAQQAAAAAAAAARLTHLDLSKLACSQEGLKLLEGLKALQILPADVSLGPGVQLTVQLQWQTPKTEAAALTTAMAARSGGHVVEGIADAPAGDSPVVGMNSRGGGIEDVHDAVNKIEPNIQQQHTAAADMLVPEPQLQQGQDISSEAAAVDASSFQMLGSTADALVNVDAGDAAGAVPDASAVQLGGAETTACPAEGVEYISDKCDAPVTLDDVVPDTAAEEACDTQFCVGSKRPLSTVCTGDASSIVAAAKRKLHEAPAVEEQQSVLG